MASFLFSMLTPLFFSWLLPIMVCHLVWTKKAPEKPSKLLLSALFPVMFFGLIVGEFAARSIRPEFYADRGDNPSQIAEFIVALMLCWTYIPIITRLAEMKQPGYSRKKIDLIWFLRLVEIVLWVPISLGLIFSANLIFVLLLKPSEILNPRFLTFLLPIFAILIPLGVKRWRKSLESAKSNRSAASKSNSI
jgi:hypothetical protein